MRRLPVLILLTAFGCSEGADPRIVPDAQWITPDVGGTRLDAGDAEDAGHDAGPSDRGTTDSAEIDGAADSGADFGTDSGADSGTDSGTDSGADFGTDSGADFGTDSGADSGADFGTDSGADSGTDSGADSGADTGPSDAGVASCVFVGQPTEVDAYNSLLTCLRDANTLEADRLSMVADFVARVNAGSGFPIVDGNAVIFFTVTRPEYDLEDDKDPAEDFDPMRRLAPISVAGDFNMFMPGQDILQDEGLGVFHTRLTLSTPLGDRWRYKFVAKDTGNADVWYSDPLSRRFDYDQNGRLSIIAGGTAQGHLELMRMNAPSLGGERLVYVYLPPDYENGTTDLPVLYAHDGNNLFDASQPNSAPVSWDLDGVIERELGLLTMNPMIVVAITNSPARLTEYTHVQDNIGQGLVGGGADVYADFIVQDLLPAVDTRYRTSSLVRERGVLGSSLGGLVAFHIGLRHPTQFGFVAGLSSTFSWGRIGATNPTMPERYTATPNLGMRQQIFYLDSGGGPGAGCPAGSSDNYCSTIDMLSVLMTAGFTDFPDNPDLYPLTPPVIDIMHWWENGAPHNEAAWNARVHRALRLFARR